MGFEPILTGVTFQRVSRFATATPIGTPNWYPMTESNCRLLDVSQASCRLTNGTLVEPDRFELSSSCLQNRSFAELSYDPLKLALHGRIELPSPN